MTGTASRIDDDVICQVLSPFLSESQLAEKVRNVALVSLRGWIFLSYDGIELRLRMARSRTKPVIPDVERFERPPQAQLNQLGHLADQGRSDHLLQHGLGPRFGNLAVLLETSCHQGRRRRCIRVRLAHRPVSLKQ